MPLIGSDFHIVVCEWGSRPAPHSHRILYRDLEGLRERFHRETQHRRADRSKIPDTAPTGADPLVDRVLVAVGGGPSM
jgi:hypothetical protein